MIFGASKEFERGATTVPVKRNVTEVLICVDERIT